MENLHMCEQDRGDFHVFSLHQIAGWQKLSTDNRELPVHIPAIQRGLVWNATQAEVLWDSLMRGIPIGTFTLIDGKDGYLELLDGQQRANAIAMGFRAMPSDGDTDEEKRKPLLWIDLAPTLSEDSRCMFVFRVTTPGQPWGYKLPTVTTENNTNRLDVEQRRKVLDENGIARSSISARKPFPCLINRPYGANRPVLFSSLLDGSFSGDVPDEIKKGLENIRRTKIFAICSSAAMHEENWLPTFFTRMNKQGVEPDQEEILYSNAKHLIPELKTADECAHKCGIRASRVANVMLKVFLSEQENRWESSIDLKTIYQIKEFDKLNNFITDFPKRLQRICQWCAELPDGPVPPVTISMFAMRHPAVYQWLLLMANHPEDEIPVSGLHAIGCASVLSWFYCDDKAEEACKTLFQFKTGISLLPLVYLGLLALPPRPEEIPNGETFPFTGDIWPCFNRYSLAQSASRVSRLWNGFDNKEGCELLLFACRKFMNTIFPDHGMPESYWQEDNRPWDYDHIVPKAWLACGRGNRQGRYHELVGKYLMSIGNSAPIPFSVNRAKNASAPGRDYCGEMQPALYLKSEVLATFQEGGSRLEEDMDKAQDFVRATSTRFSELYASWYNSLEIGNLFDFESHIGFDSTPYDVIRSRRESFVKLMGSNPQLKVYAVIDCYEYELDLNGHFQEWWFLKWLSIGIASSDGKSFIAISTDGKQWQTGLRKHPSLSEVDADYGDRVATPLGFRRENHDWWYHLREVQGYQHLGIPDDIYAGFTDLISFGNLTTSSGSSKAPTAV